MDFCIICKTQKNIDRHHVCWYKYYFYKKDTEQHRIRHSKSWKRSLTVQVCRECHDAIHNSSKIDDFIAIRPNVPRENIESAYLIMEDAVRLSYLTPLINEHLMGRDYFFVSKNIGTYREAMGDVTIDPRVSVFGLDIYNGTQLIRKERIKELCISRFNFYYERAHKKPGATARISDTAVLNCVNHHRGKIIGRAFSKNEVQNVLEDFERDGIIEQEQHSYKKRGKMYTITQRINDPDV